MNTESDGRGSLTVSARTVTIVAILTAAVALVSRAADSSQAWAAALRITSATLALTIVPGALVTLAWRPRPQVSLLALLGYGVAISAGLVQLLTIAAVSAHLSPVISLTLLGVAAALVGSRAIRRDAAVVTLSTDEVVIACALILLAVPLYLQGSPVAVYEDQVLAAVTRRLSALDAPGIGNFYVTPDVPYTYPFPGGLYLMALIARLSDLDPLFVYHKLRFFWGPAAIVMLYLGARAIFGYASVAAAVALAAVVFVCTGAFGEVAGFPAWWAQLVPYSYLPDVAMTVLLPALLVLACEFIQSDSRRDRAFLFFGVSLLVVMLTMIHIREVIQFAAYIGCFLVLAALVRPFRRYVRSAATLLAFTIATALAYVAWQSRVVQAVGDIVSDHRAGLASLAADLPARSLVLAPAPAVLGDVIQDFDQIWAGMVPFFLLAGPAVVMLFRDRPLVWLLGSSTAAYLAVMSIPLLAIPYVYVTYFEMLHVPVRNVIWFMYLFAGAGLYAVVVVASRARGAALVALVVGAGAGVVALVSATTLDRSHAGFSLPLIAAYILPLAYLGITTRAATRQRSPLRRTGPVVMAVAMGIAALAAMWPDVTPPPRSEQVTIRWEDDLADGERQALERRFSLTRPELRRDVEGTVSNYRLTDLSIGNVRAIVTHPAVADTHFIDRSSFIVESQPPPGDHLPLGVRYVRWLQYPGVWLAGVATVVMWAVAFALPASIAYRGSAVPASLWREPLSRRALPFALLLLGFAVWSARPTLSPLTVAPMAPAGRADTPAALLSQIPCVTTPPMPARFAEEDVVLPERTTCPPDPGVVAWLRTQAPVNGVLAVDRWTAFPPQVFVPQQAVVFPTLDASFIHEDALFAKYYGLFDERMRRHHVQPFFNAVETPEEREAFVKALGVTHILISPNHHAELRPVLDTLPAQFALRYDHAQWAVYESLSNLN